MFFQSAARVGEVMTKAELLKATGNIWRVDCWHDGNRRRIVQTLAPEKRDK